MQEIERKFLIKDISQLNLTQYRKLTITQAYLYNDKYTAIRKRKVVEGEKIIYYYTVKTGKFGNYGTEEIECEISKKNYEKLNPSSNINIIVKDRYIIPIENNLKIELDVFHECFEGIIFAEIEFSTEKMAEEYDIPKWFDKELSGKISNSKMSRLSKKEIEGLIEKI